MTWSSRFTAGALLALTALCQGSCGDNETLMIELSADATCTESLLEDLRAADVELRDPASQRSECRPTGKIETVGDLQKALAGLFSFLDVEEGAKTLSVRGYTSSTCEGDDVIVCGKASFDLPPNGGRIKVTLSCYRGSSPPSEFKQCAGL